MRNGYQEGKTLDFKNTSGTDIESGAVVPLGGRIYIATGKIVAGGKGTLLSEEVVLLDKVADTEFSQGDRLYFDTVENELTKTQKSVFAGIAAYDAASAATQAYVKIGIGTPQAAAIPALGATAALVGVDGVGANAAPLAGTEARLDAIEAKVDAVIAALKAPGLMATA
jgi:predicted RecA/RadA family phage recombinase